MSEGTVTAAKGEPEMKGWLFKWTNYLKGYQRRWFVLHNGLLSYYRCVYNVPPETRHVPISPCPRHYPSLCCVVPYGMPT